MSITIARNGWGSQVRTTLSAPSAFLPIDIVCGIGRILRSGSPSPRPPRPSRPIYRNLHPRSRKPPPPSPSFHPLIPIKVILALTPTPSDHPIIVVAHLSRDLLPSALSSPNHSAEPRTYVAVRQGLHFLTTFHPELTNDDRFHDYFVRECVLPLFVGVN